MMKTDAAARNETICRASLRSQGISHEITLYSQSRNLLADIADDQYFYDLIILDIEMPGIDGMALAGQTKVFFPTSRICFCPPPTPSTPIDAF